MSKLINSIQKTGTFKLPAKPPTSKKSKPNANTANGAATFSTSGNSLLDLFFIIGASRGKDIKIQFTEAFNQDQTIALRMLLWARDCRGGAGERQTFRDLFRHLIQISPTLATLLLPKVPEMGRWDDVLAATYGTALQDQGFGMYAAALHAQHGLAAKWCPRKGIIANAFRKHLELTPKRYRKLIVGLSNTVEQKLCAKDWKSIDYSKLPSMAASRYSKAFTKHDAERYNAYVAALQKDDPSVKINASVIFPHDVIVNCESGNATTANEQWRRLPNYFKGTEPINILPIIDVSSSMSSPPLGDNSSVVPMTVSIALGMYFAERMPGLFKNHFLTFSQAPSLQAIEGTTLLQKIKNLRAASWGGNTNLQAAFDLILNHAKKHHLSQEDLPTHVLIVSDMEFDVADRDGNTNYVAAAKKFEAAGYKVPGIIFWNVNGRAGNVAAKSGDKNVALVSGFSPAIMQSFLENPFAMSPLSVMMRAIMNPKYDI